MLSTRYTAVFNENDDAERAVKELRRQGVADDHISVITKHAGTGAQMATGAGEGLLAGGAVGAIFGLAATMIPGVGPFVAAGFLGPALGGLASSAAAGAIVGGTAGLIAGTLTRAGYGKKEAEFYGKELESGRSLLAVDSGAAIDVNAVSTIVSQFGGRTYNTELGA